MEEARSKVWSWVGRDQASGEDLEFVIAVGSRKELQQVSVRLSLPSPKQAGRVPPSDPAYTEAMATPLACSGSTWAICPWASLGNLSTGPPRNNSVRCGRPSVDRSPSLAPTKRRGEGERDVFRVVGIVA